MSGARSVVRCLLRLPGIVLLLLAGLSWQAATFALTGPAGRRRSIRVWSRLMLRAMGVRLCIGAADADRLARLGPGRLIVANHLSWIDILAIDAVCAAAFVAKGDIRRWPVVGWLVAMAGTVFIDKGNGAGHGVPAVVGAIRARLRERHPVAVFPEGTTADGTALLRFHGRLLQAAIDEGADVLPVALALRYGDGSRAAAAHFVGTQTFMQSVLAICGARDLRIVMHVPEPVAVTVLLPQAGGPAVARTSTRDELALRVRSAIAAALGHAPDDGGALPDRGARRRAR